jgi:hypothetical protein
MLYSVDFYWFSNTIIAFLRCSVNSHDKKIEKEATAAFSILSFICIGAPKLLGNLQVLTAIVGAASLTNLMRELHLAALRALHQSRRAQLPYVVSSGITSCLRSLSLWYCHFGNTSSVYPKSSFLMNRYIPQSSLSKSF